MRVIQERNSANTPTYTRGLDLSSTLESAGGIGGLLARLHGYSGGTWSTHNFYHADASGNVTYMINSAQAMVAQYKYDPFGRTISQSGTLANDNVYCFSSKEIHFKNVPSGGPSELYYYGYRLYDAQSGRWLNRDPIHENGGINLYAFIRNSPLDRVDPLGLKIHKCTVPTSSFPTLGIGTHAYLWDDRPGVPEKDRECGQESSCGTDSKGNESDNSGPGGSKPMKPGTVCEEVAGSEGREDEIMKDCRSRANTGMWFPGLNDCHNKTDRCLRRNDLKPPPNPRFRENPDFSTDWPVGIN